MYTTIFLSSPPECWEYRHVSPLVYKVLGIKPRACACSANTLRMELHLWSLNSHFLDEYVLDLILDIFIVFCVLPECNSVIHYVCAWCPRRSEEGISVLELALLLTGHLTSKGLWPTTGLICFLKAFLLILLAFISETLGK